MSTEAPETNRAALGPGASWRLDLLVTRDADGTYSAVVWNLPGAGSCGATEAEAVERAREAALGAIEVYEADRVGVPWRDVTAVKVPPGAMHRVVVLGA